MNHPIAKLLIGAAFVGIFGAYLFWPRRLPPPVEANRVTVPGYFSIIPPAGWAPRITPGDKTFDQELLLRPAETTRREASLRVRRFREMPDVEALQKEKGYAQSELAGQTAWVHRRSTRLEYIWMFVLERNGKWYELTLSTPIPVDFAVSEWREYVESFRAE